MIRLYYYNRIVATQQLIVLSCDLQADLFLNLYKVHIMKQTVDELLHRLGTARQSRHVSSNCHSEKLRSD